jgi:hypothetical protein
MSRGSTVDFLSFPLLLDGGELGGDTNSGTERAGDEREIESVDIVAVETKASPVLGNHSTREYLHAL